MKRLTESNEDELDLDDLDYEEPRPEDFLVDENEESKQQRKPIFGRMIAFFLVIALLSSVFGVWIKMFNIPSFEFLKKSSELSQESVVAILKESIVSIEDGETKGTGFNIEPDGKIITNFHVIEDMHQIVVSFPNGKFYEATVLVKDPKLDFALLEVNGENLPFLELDMNRKWQAGDEIVVIGNPLAYTRIAIEGKILPSTNGVMMIDAPVHKGNSGSPVINQAGLVIGIVYAKSIPRVGQGESVEGFVIPVERIRDYLNK